MSAINETPPLARWASPAYAALLLLAVVAFWPGYLGLPKAGFNAWFHLHAASASLWMLMLIAQPWAILSGRRELHRGIGRASYFLMPVVVVGFVGLAHAVMAGKTGSQAAVLAYFFYIRVALLLLFVGPYVMGVIHRRDRAVHSRYMLCTGLALVDPVVHRLAHRVVGEAEFDYQLLTFGIVCVLLAVLIAMEWRARAGRHVFPVMLTAYLLLGLPAVLDFSQWKPAWTAWKSFAAAFAGLPIP